MVAVAMLLLAAAVVLFTVWLVSAEAKRRKFDKLGGLPSLPILGNVHQLKRGTREFSAQLYDICEKYGHLGIFRLLLGNYPVVLITRAEQAEFVLSSTKHIDKAQDYKFLHPWLQSGLLTSTGDKWKKRRRMLTPTFHFRILHDFIQVFNDQSEVMVTNLRTHLDGKPFDIFNNITLCALDSICETAMGRSVNAQNTVDSDYVKAVYRMTDLVFRRQRTPWYWPDLLYSLLPEGRESKKCLSILHGFTEKVIKEKQSEYEDNQHKFTSMEDMLNQEDEDHALGKKTRLAFLDMLMCANCDGERLSFLDIREEVDTFMFEGHDTTAAAMGWSTHLIGADSAIQQKVHEEMDRIFGDSDRPATMDDLKEMKYLECCIKEALRIFPSVPVFGRALVEDIEMGGITIDKGTSVVIAPGAIHRDKKYFPDPEKFDPDRFTLDNHAGRHPFAYIPFSAGMRNCIGQKFAILEEKVLLSSIFRNFTVKSLQEREKLYPLVELILRPENGITVTLTERRPKA